MVKKDFLLGYLVDKYFSTLNSTLASDLELGSLYSFVYSVKEDFSYLRISIFESGFCPDSPRNSVDIGITITPYPKMFYEKKDRISSFNSFESRIFSYLLPRFGELKEDYAKNNLHLMLKLVQKLQSNQIIMDYDTINPFIYFFYKKN